METNKEKVLYNFDLITPEIAKENGISKTSFYNFVEDNYYERVGHGVYTAKDTFLDELYIIHLRCPNAVFSHDEAFYHYGLSDREPLMHTLTMYSGFNPHRLVSGGKCKVYTVKKELLELGKTTITNNFGNKIPMYDLERTICDLIRSRSNIEINEFKTVIKSYIARKEKDLNRLMKYATAFKIQNVVRRYMEVLI